MAFIMKHWGWFFFAFIFLCLIAGLASDWNKKPDAYQPYPKMYNRSGVLLRQMRIFCDTIIPTTGNGQTVDISAAGFSTICNAVVTAQKNTATLSDIPLVSVKNCTTTTLTVNIINPNMSLVTLLGSGVLLGGAVGFEGAPTNVRLNVMVMGY